MKVMRYIPVLLAALAAPLGAQPMVGVGIDEAPGASLPLNVPFTDHNGNVVTLGDYFGDERPVVLNLVYYRCPSVCNANLTGLAATINDSDLKLGDSYRVVTVSFDPAESAEVAGPKRDAYLRTLTSPGDPEGWVFLTGDATSIERLTQAVGFRYVFQDDIGEFAHDSAAILCTPDGRVSKYLRGSVYEPRTFRLALVEASEGGIGTLSDRVWVKVCGYDPKQGKYVVMAQSVMMIGGGVTLLAVILTVALLMIWERRRRRAGHVPGSMVAVAKVLSVSVALFGFSGVAMGQEPVPEGLKPWQIYPDTQTPFAREVDLLTNFINIVSLVCFLGIIVFMVYFAVKFRRKDPHQKALSQKSHNTALEVSWTVPPLILVIIMFYYGVIGFIELNTDPDNAYTVTAQARRWTWSFVHPNGRIDAKETLEAGGETFEIPPILHVPAGEPVIVEIVSDDVLHSFYVPVFRVKKDAVPGRKTYLWFEAIDPTPNAYDPYADKESDDATKARKLKLAADSGHRLYCAEYCGTDHSNMLAQVVVHPNGWRPAAVPIPTTHPEKGRHLFNKTYQCNGCHAVTAGSIQLAGPSFAGGVLGKEERIQGLGAITIDKAYIRESILSPNVKIVEGYQPLMPTTFGNMPEDHIEAIIIYLESLGGAE